MKLYLVTEHQITRVNRSRAARLRSDSGPGWALMRIGEGSMGVPLADLPIDLQAAVARITREAGGVATRP